VLVHALDGTVDEMDKVSGIKKPMRFVISVVMGRAGGPVVYPWDGKGGPG
jgi:hypothetical protein